MPQEFLNLDQLNNLFGKEQVEETFGNPQETFTPTDGGGDGGSGDQGTPPPAAEPVVPASVAPDDNIPPVDPDATGIPPVTPPIQTTVGLNSVISSLVSSGDWEDVAIKYDGKEYNSLDDLMKEKQIDMDLFNELLETQKELKDEKISSSYLKLDDPNSVNANLAKAILQGQDYKDLLSDKENTIDPIANLDFTFIPNDTEDRQRAENDAANLLIWHHENNLGYNLQDTFVRKALFDKINSLKENLELLDTAESVKQGVINQFNKDLEQRFAAEETLKQQQHLVRKQEIKNYKDSLKSKGYTDNFIKDVTSLRYEEDKTTSSPQYLSVIKAKVEADPEFATEILHFLLDKEGYLGAQKLPEKLNTQRRMIEVSGKAKKTSTSNQSTGAVKQAQSESDNIIMNLFGGE